MKQNKPLKIKQNQDFNKYMYEALEYVQMLLDGNSSKVNKKDAISLIDSALEKARGES